MKDDLIFGVIVFAIGFFLGAAIGSVAVLDDGAQAGAVACHSINKTWALIDGQYMCVTVTE